MQHNLFKHPSECTVILQDDGYEIKHFIESENLLETLEDLGYDETKILNQLKNNLEHSCFSTEKEKSDTLHKLELYLRQNGYLRTTN